MIERVKLHFAMQSMFKGDVERACTRSVTTPSVIIILQTKLPVYLAIDPIDCRNIILYYLEERVTNGANC